MLQEPSCNVSGGRPGTNEPHLYVVTSLDLPGLDNRNDGPDQQKESTSDTSNSDSFLRGNSKMDLTK